jgi:hypothetical protein
MRLWGWVSRGYRAPHMRWRLRRWHPGQRMPKEACNERLPSAAVLAHARAAFLHGNARDKELQPASMGRTQPLIWRLLTVS